MPDVLIHNVPQDILDALEQQAEKHSRSLEEELLTIIEQAAPARPASREEAIRAIHEWQEHWKKQGKVFSDSTELIREDRER